ncbi:MAG: hypothetical protein JXP73_10235 [Deltaproteobacteria bacterium]|nr:hypothetical protein [Deltaproteobacteria bacterium]
MGLQGIKNRIAALGRALDGKPAVAERIAAASAAANTLMERLAQAIARHKANPAPPRKVSDEELAVFARECPDAIGQAVVAQIQARREGGAE